MKCCPTCKQIFAEPHLSFCTEDGTPLIEVEDPPYDPETTLVSARPPSNSTTFGTTQTPRPPNGPSSWPSEQADPGYQKGTRFVPAPSPSRAWPWVFGIVLLLMIAGAGVAAAFLVPNMIRSAPAGDENKVVKPNANRPDDNRNASASRNSNSSNTNSNANASSPGTTTPPTDEPRVLSALTDIENEWQVANVEGDKQRLEHILADDYVGTQADGTIQGKADYIKDLKPDPTIKHSEFQNLKVTLNGDRATLSGEVKLAVEVEGQDQAQELLLRFTDKFVWRDARWQAVGSEVSRVR